MNLISRNAAEQLGLELKEPYMLTYVVVGGQLRQQTFRKQLKLVTCDGDCYEIWVNVLDELPGRSMKLSAEFWDQHPYLSKAKGKVPENNEPVDLLLGYGLKGLSLPLEIASQPESVAFEYPTAMRSALGWTLFGPVKTCSQLNYSPEGRVCTLEADEADRDLTRSFSDWCKGETLGVEATQLCQCRPGIIEENAFLKAAKEYVHKDDEGRMVVRLPWKPGFPSCLPNNRKVAVGALSGLMKTLRNKGLYEQYAQEMQRIIQEYTEPVQADQLSNPCWYLQHFW